MTAETLLLQGTTVFERCAYWKDRIKEDKENSEKQELQHDNKSYGNGKGNTKYIKKTESPTKI